MSYLTPCLRHGQPVDLDTSLSLRDLGLAFKFPKLQCLVPVILPSFSFITHTSVSVLPFWVTHDIPLQKLFSWIQVPGGHIKSMLRCSSSATPDFSSFCYLPPNYPPALTSLFLKHICTIIVMIHMINWLSPIRCWLFKDWAKCSIIKPITSH